MATYERRTTVDAPLEDVWTFYSRASGLEAVTPAWMGLRIESVVGPDGKHRSGELEAGSEVSVSTRPFGIGPRQYWSSEITELDRKGERAYFRDRMVHGPFDRWVHTHSFFADGDRTIVHDHVEYELPLGPLSEVASIFSWIGFEAMFWERHRKTKALIEGASRPRRTANAAHETR
ncbi:SRPBCC family protein [Natrarchaeobius chitinivorans]|uniref:Cyclase n=1 Tax=Natrarchaeobius chitinivorans TaxID=1679083 RepID=A0A3N6MDP8_NATCH|nr:SRPBCC family protein [Natrarchaeobius chitinivorans]RQG91936.1 cyclase [Natrarchaeobius chitinivorans]